MNQQSGEGRGAGGKGGPRRTPPGSPRAQAARGASRQGGTAGKGAKAAAGGRGQRPVARRNQPPVGGAPAVDVHDPDGVRLQKVLAQAGIASRRASEDLIAAGRVTVDGQVVTELGVRVDPDRAVIHVDGMRLQLDTTKVYLALNKPRGVVATMSDPEGRPSIGDLVGDRTERLFHVGRLDADTEGLLLVTNDGDFSHRLQHPSYEVPKTYLAEIPGPVPRDLGKRLREGVELDDGLVQVDSFKMIDSKPGRALVEIVLHEGRHHIVRRLLKEVGHPVMQLVRVQIGPVLLGDLLPGKNRPLTREELGVLMADLGL